MGKPRRRAPARARKRAAARPRARPAPPAAPRRRVPLPTLQEPPRGHIVCRGCGRIQSIALEGGPDDRLLEMTERAPTGWIVERVAYSLAAVCPRCQAAAPPP